MSKLDYKSRTNRYINPIKEHNDAPSKIGVSSMLWFGKYKGSSVANILKQDKQYLKWILSNVKNGTFSHITFSVDLINLLKD